MSFISHAQNFEDVMLWRALKHIETGFYIDVGANDPEVDSVTKAFYELGWRGLNIEPVLQWFQRLQETRVRDINLQLAIGSEPGEIILYEIPHTGLSTAEKAFADRHEAELGYQNRELKVAQDTLANICEQYHIAPIHFLKIDVEGMEKAVLEGADFGKIRPWIVLVESTFPNSQKESHGEWEPTLLNAGYQHAYSDGINRFYVAEEHSELSSAFQYPPNVFDDFVLKRHLETEARARGAETHAQEAESELEKIRANTAEYQNQLERSANQIAQLEHELSEKKQELASKLSELQQEHDRSQWLQNEWDAAKAKNEELNQSSNHWWAVADGLNRELTSIYQSKFWRLTWPLRKAMQGLKGVLQFLAGLIRLPKKAARWFLTKTISYILRRERLKYRARQYLYRHPKLEAHLRAFARSRGLSPGFMPPHRYHAESTVRAEHEKENAQVNSGDPTNNAEQLSTLTPRARRIYKDLKSAIEKRHGSTG